MIPIRVNYYWAQWQTPYSPEVMNLFIVDTETAVLEDAAKLENRRAGVRGMFIPLCEHDSNVKAVEERAATCTEEGHTAYWQCQTCGKYFTDEKLTIEISWEDTVIPALAIRPSSGTPKRPPAQRTATPATRFAPSAERLKEGQVIPANCPSKAFADLNTDRWYHEYSLDYVIARELMNGMDETHFAPGGGTSPGASW